MQVLQPLEKNDDFARAEEVAARLDLIGGIQAIRLFSKENRFRFRVLRPGKTTDVFVNVETWQAKEKNTTTNVCGVIHYLHQFDGVQIDNAKEMRDWFATAL